MSDHDNDGESCSEHGILLTEGCYLCDPDDYVLLDGHWMQISIASGF
jgi:hypothetical protein